MTIVYLTRSILKLSFSIWMFIYIYKVNSHSYFANMMQTKYRLWTKDMVTCTMPSTSLVLKKYLLNGANLEHNGYKMGKDQSMSQ